MLGKGSVGIGDCIRIFGNRFLPRFVNWFWWFFKIQDKVFIFI